MILHFHKMTGAGNDFVMVDNRDLSLSDVLTHDNIAAVIAASAWAVTVSSPWSPRRQAAM